MSPKQYCCSLNNFLCMQESKARREKARRTASAIILYKGITTLYSVFICGWVVKHFGFITSLLFLSVISVGKSWLIVYTFDKLKIDKIKIILNQSWFIVRLFNECKILIQKLGRIFVLSLKILKRKWRWLQKIPSLRGRLRVHLQKIKRFSTYMSLFLWDSALLILWLRTKEDVFNGIPKKRWNIFLVSCFLSTLSWIGGIEGVIFLVAFGRKILNRL